jgi:hypothetical protein
MVIELGEAQVFVRQEVQLLQRRLDARIAGGDRR